MIIKARQKQKVIFHTEIVILKKLKKCGRLFHRILKPRTFRIKFDPETLNNHYTTLASRLCNKENITFNAEELISELHVDDGTKFQLRRSMK